MTSLPPQGDALSPPPGGWELVSLTHRTHLNTQLYKALQLNCEPYLPFPRTPGDLHRIARFRMNGSQKPWLAGLPTYARATLPPLFLHPSILLQIVCASKFSVHLFRTIQVFRWVITIIELSTYDCPGIKMYMG